jgi:hypothetical protein
MEQELINTLTEKYLNPPYRMPFPKARELAMTQAAAQRAAEARKQRARKAGSEPAKVFKDFG